ncbi:hypothetical protein BKA64DRAFT_711087 [Cadophora sp. MPI-SDFR-AT-0126]|nr:hypothetical protein BKA64DRAFT_711087 [Leotiomycetes sp. MPI-SDFR-AT-0126]
MPGRVGESSRRSTRTRTPRSSPSKPSSSSPRSSQKKGTASKHKKKRKEKTQEAEGADDFYAIKRIVDQEERDGEAWYLVDWEDHEITGESYPPSWARVTLLAVAEWQNKSKDRNTPHETSSPHDEPETSESSQPALPRKRKRKLVSGAGVAVKRSRHGSPQSSGSGAPQVIPQGANALEREKYREAEIPDSYEEEREHWGRTHIDSQEVEADIAGREARVEVGAPKDFDPGAYATHNLSSSSQAFEPPSQFSSDLVQSEESQTSEHREIANESRPTQSSSAPQARQLSPDIYSSREGIENGEARLPDSSSQPHVLEVPSDPIQSSVPVISRSSQAPFIWDSDIEGEESENEEPETLEVPDSQDPRGSSSYKPSETPTSESNNSTDTTTRRNTQSNTEASLGAVESRNSQLYSSPSKQQDSGSVQSQFVQRASDFDNEGYTQTPEPTSAQVQLTQTQKSHDSETFPSDPQLPGSASQPVDESSGPPARISSTSPFRSQEPSQSSPAKPSEEKPSIGFQTQLPRISCEEDSGEQLLPPLSYHRNQHLESQLDLDLPSKDLQGAQEEESPTEQIFERQSDPRSFNSTDWQDSRVLSQSQAWTQTPKPIETFSGLNQSDCASGTREDPIQIVSPEKETFPEALASQTGNTQRSSSSKGSGHSQASSHLPSPPVEDIRPTIEDIEPFDVKYPPTIYSSSSMEPSDVPAVVVSDQAKVQAPDPTAMLKATIAAKRAERAAAALSQSPVPGLNLSNQSAVAVNQTLPIQPSAERSPPAYPAVPLFESPAAPSIDSSRAAASLMAAPTSAEDLAPSPPPAIMESIAYPEDDDEEEPTSLSVLPLGPAEYEVPLPMTSYTRDIYVRRIKIYRVQLQSFLRDEVLDEALVAEVKSLLETLQTICSHPGLLDAEPSQNEDHEIQAKWAENVSTKFIFLAELLELMRATDNHVVLVAQPGQILDELESLLIFHTIEYSRADKGRTIYTGRLRVTIYPAGAMQYSVDPASLLIAFDPSYRALPFLEQLRTQPSFPDQLAPLVSLVVTNSVDHIDRCFDSNIEAPGRLIKIASCMRQLVGRVGTFEEHGYDDPPGAASKIAAYLLGGPREGSWPLLPMPDIHGLDLSLLSSQNFAEEPSAYDTASSANFQSGVKRSLESEESVVADKRQRLTPNNGSGEVDSSHVSETVLRTSSTPMASRPVVSLAEDERMQISSLLQKVSSLEAQLRAKDATEIQLREINQDLESRCKGYEDSIAAIQPKYQEALNDRGEFEHRINLSMAREIKLRKERDNKDAQVIKLRERNAELEAELSTAQTALRTSAVPEAAELATLRDELAKSRLETEREQKRYINANNDLDYIRSTFQTSSSTAAEHQAEVFQLQTELDAFREKAAHDKVRIHEIQSTNETAELRLENTELRARLKDLERDYEKKQQELNAVTNGRRGTRGTSVPQSPRMGNQNQNSPGTRPIGRVLHGGSRGNSPAPGDVRVPGGPGPFAGGHFGDALFPNSLPPPPPRDRWAQHLQ